MLSRFEITINRFMHGLVFAPAVAGLCWLFGSISWAAFDPAWHPHWGGRSRATGHLLAALPIPFREFILLAITAALALLAIYLALVALQLEPVAVVDETGVSVRNPFYRAHMPWTAIRSIAAHRGNKPDDTLVSTWEFDGSGQASFFGMTRQISRLRISGYLSRGMQRDLFLFVKRINPGLTRPHEHWLSPQSRIEPEDDVPSAPPPRPPDPPITVNTRKWTG
jgi:hypothetical protein